MDGAGLAAVWASPEGGVIATSRTSAGAPARCGWSTASVSVAPGVSWAARWASG